MLRRRPPKPHTCAHAVVGQPPPASWLCPVESAAKLPSQPAQPFAASTASITRRSSRTAQCSVKWSPSTAKTWSCFQAICAPLGARSSEPGHPAADVPAVQGHPHRDPTVVEGAPAVKLRSPPLEARFDPAPDHVPGLRPAPPADVIVQIGAHHRLEVGLAVRDPTGVGLRDLLWFEHEPTLARSHRPGHHDGRGRDLIPEDAARSRQRTPSRCSTARRCTRAKP